MSEELKEALSVAESNVRSLEAALRNKDELLAQTRIVCNQYLADYNRQIDRIDELEKENESYERLLQKERAKVKGLSEIIDSQKQTHDALVKRCLELEEAALQRIVEVGELQTALERIAKLEAQNKRMREIVDQAERCLVLPVSSELSPRRYQFREEEMMEIGIEKIREALSEES